MFGVFSLFVPHQSRLSRSTCCPATPRLTLPPHVIYHLFDQACEQDHCGLWCRSSVYEGDCWGVHWTHHVAIWLLVEVHNSPRGWSDTRQTPHHLRLKWPTEHGLQGWSHGPCTRKYSNKHREIVDANTRYDIRSTEKHAFIPSSTQPNNGFTLTFLRSNHHSHLN